MQFTHSNEVNGNKAGKFAVVAGLHVLVGTLFVHSLNTRHISLPKVQEDLLVMLTPEAPKPPPPPPEPPKPMPKTAPPEVVVPKVEVDVPPPEVVPPVQATTEPDPTPMEPAPAQVEAPPAPPSTNNTGAMHTAVLADGCATPEYPAAAARDGVEGTVTLALMIGADGSVNGSKVAHSSGSRVLDKAALNALSMCKFKPAMENGVPTAGWGQIAYVWKLQ